MATGATRQTSEKNGCLQNWRTQICACSPKLPPEPSEDELRLQAESDARQQRAEAEADLQREQQRLHEEELRRLERERYPPEAMAPCFTLNTEYEPMAAEHGVSRQATPGLCQNLCARTAGCSFFSWRPTEIQKSSRSATCLLHKGIAQQKVVPHAVSGPAACHEATEEAAGVPDIHQSKPPWDDEPDMPVESYAMQDPEGDSGTYVGPVNAWGRAQGLGELRYDQGAVFVGTFEDGRMVEGAVHAFPEYGQQIVTQDTMVKIHPGLGRWTKSVDSTIAARYPPTKKAADSRLARYSQDSPPEPERPTQQSQEHKYSTREPHARHAEQEPTHPPPRSSQAPARQLQTSGKISESFMAEGSPYTVAFVVLAFGAAAASGVLDKPE